MSQVLPKENSLTKCNALLIESNLLYRLMLQTLKSMSGSPETATAQQLHAKLLKFNALQQQIEAGDAQLADALQGLSAHDHVTKTLLDERRTLVEQVLAGNKMVTLQAQAIQSLLADEIRKSTTGHAALKGYRQPDQQRSSTSFRRAM